MICSKCSSEYEKSERIGKPGKLIHCPSCAEEEQDIEKYTGNMIFSHKTAPSIQINKDPNITKFINGKIAGDTTHKSGSVVKEAESFNYKGR